jgi:hypothetical protein
MTQNRIGEKPEEQWQGGMDGLREMIEGNKLLIYSLGWLGFALLLMIIIRLITSMPSAV